MENQKQTKDYSENPQEIIDESFDIIDNLVDFDNIPEAFRPIVRRVIHATGDTDYADNLIISPTAVEAATKAIATGKSIITDVNMVKAGISAKAISRFGGKIICRIADDDVAAKAKESGKTRAITAMQESLADISGGIVVIGNAPTAVFSIIDIIDDPDARWLSVCFYNGTITDPDSKGILIPQGILGEDGYCFDLEEFDETLLCYLEKRMDEAYNSALPAHL